MQLMPHGVIPRDPLMVLRARRTPDAAECPPLTPKIKLPAGADLFAGATTIPLLEYDNVPAEYTYNKSFTTEAGEPNTIPTSAPHKTAWWKIDVPKGIKAWLDIDLERSFGNSNRPDTQLAVFSGTELSTFGDLFRIAFNEDVNTDFSFSRLGPIEMAGNSSGEDQGTTFFIQAGDKNNGIPGIAYGLRVSITFTQPGTTPDDGHDPDV